MKVFRREVDWSVAAAQMEAKRIEIEQKLRVAKKLQVVVALIYDHRSAVRFDEMVRQSRFADIHKLSEEQLSGRMAELREMGLLVPLDQEGTAWSLTFFGKNFVGNRIERLRAGNL